MRNIHRILAIGACLVLLYLGVTGSWMTLIDLSTTLGGAPESDATMRSINEGKDGNADYAVLSAADYTAKPLPGALDVQRTMAAALPALRRLAPGAGATFVELRMAGDRPVVQARFGQQPMFGQGEYSENIRAVDAATGAGVPAVDAAPMSPIPTTRQSLKEWHRFWTRHDKPAVYFELLSGIALWVLLITGLTLYFRLLKQRRKIKRPQMFWMTSDSWRGWHRGVSVTSAILLLVVAATGTWLGFESTWHTFVPRSPHHDVPALSDDEVIRLAGATAAATRAATPGVPIKVVRVRDYWGMKQGVVVTDEKVTRQIVFDTATGRQVGLNEPNYPATGFPLGIGVHEFMKHLHSGFLFGWWARAFDLLAGLALVFLSGSGLWMYVEMYRKRLRSGRRGLFWT